MTKHYYKATIQYDGTDYNGFQWQENARSIQLEFNQAIQSIAPGKITTMGASRTDTGVHAMEQVVKITAENQIDDSNFLHKFNQKLPPQIRCMEITPCTWDFAPANQTLSKEYRYFFTNIPNTPNDKKFIANFHLKLDTNLIMNYIPKIVGTHDFKNFCSASDIANTVREINICELTEINPHEIFMNTTLFTIPHDVKSCFQLRIEGQGFLKQMVRHLLSALWMVGSGKLTPEEFSHLLNGQEKDQRLWKVAPPNGLFLYKINYQKG